MNYCFTLLLQRKRALGLTRQFAAFFISFIFSTVVFANPEGGQVRAGNVVISAPGPNQVNVQQNSDKAIIDWHSFNIQANEHTHFQQPNGGVVLNRIDPAQGVSQIYGKLTATGKVILINQAGIFFGPGSYVNVGGLIAATANMTNENFLQGKFIFDQPSLYGGSIINKGEIHVADYGLAALLGDTVDNDGYIEARLGKVVMASGSAFTMDLYGDGLINFEVTGASSHVGKDENGNPLRDAVKNTGIIQADGGSVLVSAKNVSSAIDHLINMDGVIQTKSVSMKNGEIILSGESDGIVKVSGKIDASGEGQGETGGKVHVLGKNIVIDSPAIINVSGDVGGGEILIGGDYQGSGSIPHASETYIAHGATLLSDAIRNGNGGKIVAWSDGVTIARGYFSARGGIESGDGGDVETSGYYLDVMAIQKVDLTAPHGRIGTWLLDPSNVNITDSSTANINFSSGQYTPGLLAVVSVTLNAGDLGTQLNSANVKVVTTNALGIGSGDITLNDPANQLQTNWANASTTLTLQADRNITFSSNLTLNGTGKTIVLDAGNTTASGSVALNNTLDGSFNLTITTGSSGTVTFGAAVGGTTALTSLNTTGSSGININTNTINTTGAQTYNNTVTLGTSSAVAGGAISFQAVSLGANTLTVNTTSASSAISGIVSGSGSLVKSGSGTLTLSGVNTFGGTTTISGGVLKINADSGLGAAPGSPTAGAIAIGGGTLQTTNTFTLNANRGIALNSGGGILLTDSTKTLTYNGIISGSNALTKQGDGALILGGANSYTGGTTISAGTLQLGASGVLADTGVVTLADVSGAILNLNGFSETISTLSGGGSSGGNITLGSGTLTVTQASDATYAGVISGSGGLTKAGNSTLILSGANSYTGATNINAGVLEAQNNTSLGTTDQGTTIANGAALQINGSGLNIAEALTITGTGISGQGVIRNIAGNNTLSGAISLSGTSRINNDANTLTLTGGVTGAGQNLTIGGSGNTTISTTGVNTVGGTLTKDGSGVLLFNAANSYTGLTTINAGIMRLGASNRIADTSGISLANDASVIFDLNDFSETIGTLSGGGSAGGNITLGSGTLTVTQTSDANYSGIISGSGGLTKAGANVLTLFGVNTYTGATTINAGTLRLGASDRIANSSDLTLADAASAVFDLNGFNETIANLTGGGSTGGNITLGAGTLTATQSLDGTYAGVISGSGGFTKAGSAILTLSGTNTYSGVTNINAGAIYATNNNSLGDTVGNTIIANNAALHVGGGVTIAEALNITGTGLSSAGAIRSISGNNTLSGAITLAGSSRINSDANTLTLTGGITGAGQALTIGGNGNTTISTTGVNTSTAGTLTKDGSGTLLLNAANNYTGATTINAGTLRLGASDRIANSSDVVLADVAGAIFDLNGFDETIANLTGGGSTGGNITLGAGTLTATQSLDGTYAGVISGSGGFTKAGTAILTLSGTNTYSGVTNINAGAIYATNNNSLGDTVGNTVIANNAELHVGGGVTIAEALNITGTGLSGAGVVRSISGNNTLSGAITLASGSRINSDANTLTLTGGITGAGQALTIGGSGNTTISTTGVNTSTAGTLTKDGSGVLLLNATNNYTGATTINAGTLRLGASDRIADSSDLTLADVASAVFDLNGFNETIANLTGGGSTGGNITLGAGTLTATQSLDGTYAGVISGSGGFTKAGTAILTLSGTNTYSGVTNINAGAIYATNNNSLGDTVGNTVIANNAALHLSGGITIAEALNITGTGLSSAGAIRSISGNNILSGAITLAGSSRINSDANTLTLTGGVIGTGQALTIGGSGNTTISTTGINTSTAGTLTKDGSGTLLLNATNNYTGATTINAGTLRLGASDRIANSSDVVLADVAGAIFDLNGFNETIANLTGGGSTGGNITLGAGTLTATQSLDGAYAGVISGSGGFTKAGSAILTLSGANTYSGVTNINAGAIYATNNNSLGDTVGNTVIANNAALHVGGGVTIAEALNITGTGLSGAGVVRSISGNNTLSGAITLAGSSRINSDANTLTLTGGIVGTGQALTIGGSGNTTISTTGINISTAGTLTKDGSGTLLLNAANNYTGATTINAGTLRLGASDRIANSSDVVLADVASAVFDLNGFDETIANLTGGGSTGGNITLGAGTLTATQSLDGAYAGVISGSGGFTKAGTAILTLSGTNTYSGVTNINAGAIYATNNNSLGDTVGNTIIANNAALHIGGGVTIAEALNITGTGLSSAGAIRSISGNNTLSGAITLAGSSRINSDANTLTLTGGITGAGQALTIGGSGNTTISTTGINTSTAGTLTKDGSGVLLLNATNNYTGATTINAGTLRLGASDRIADSSDVVLADVASAVFDLNGFNETIANLTGGGSTGGNITLGAGTLTATQSLDGTYAGVISGSGGFTKAGTAILTLSGTNTYSGVTNINAGAIYATNNNSLGDTVGNTIIANNAALHIGGGVTIAEALNITGTGLSGAGVVRSISGNNTLSGAITLASGSRINSDANTLTLTGGITGAGQALTIGGSGNTTISTTGINTSTAGTLTKDGSGILLLNATNNYTGATTINAGTLRLGASDRIANSSDVVLADVASAIFDLNGFDETIANLTGGGSAGGNITLGAGTLTATQSLDGTYAGVISGSGGFTKAGSAILTLSGANTYSGVTNINAGAIYATNNNSLGDAVGNTVIANNAALHIGGGVTIAEALNITGTGLSGAGVVRSISGNNTLSGAITLASGSRINSDANTLTLTGGITGAGQALTIGGSGNTTISTTGVNTSTAGTLTKDGSGVLLLNATNNYTGATTINAGTLRLGASDRIANSSDVVLADVASAVFDLNGFDETIANLTGGGSTGGNVTLGVGTLTATQSLDGIYAGVISGSGGFTKAGTAILTLSGTNTYSGVTNINAGAIYATNNNSLGDTVGNTIIANNAALHIGGGVTIAEALNITGTGLSSAGAIRSISGNNTLSGAITLAGSSRINSDANTLTLTGGIVGTGQALTIGGSGNTTISTTGINTSTAGTLTKDGSGVLLLNATNNYTGATTINAGTLRLGASDRIADSSDLTLADVAGAIFDLNGFNETIANLTGGGLAGGNITLGAGALLTVTQSVDGTYAGVISGSGGFTKAGTAILTLSGTNTYSGVTNINAGAIYATNNNSLGDTVGNTIIANNAALHIGGGVTIAEALNITGTGLSSAGAIRSISGNNTLSGAITLAGSSRINSDANTLTLTGGIVGTGQALTIGGSGNTTISTTGINTSTAGTLTKDGSGVLLLNATNNYTGATTINAGTLRLGASDRIANSSDVVLADVASAVFDLNGFDETIANLTGGGLAGGNITLGAGALLTVTQSVDGTYAGVISGSGGFTKAGTAILTLSGTNTYSGVTNINAGAIYATNNNSLGDTVGNTIIANNAALHVGGGITIAEALNITGTGLSSAGAIRSISGNNTLSGAITLAGSSRINSDANTLTLTGGITGIGQALTIGGSGNTTISTTGINTSTAGTLTKDGSGVLLLNATNNYTGATSINAGTLRLGASDRIADSSDLTLADVASAVFDLNGFNETIANLTGGGSTGGNITLGAGTLTATQSLDGTYAGVISGSGGFTKAGTAILTLSGTNTYSGVTNINAGAIYATNNNSLGDTVGNTIIANNAALHIAGGVTIAEALNITGTGLSSAGAVRSISGNNTLSGAITLAGSSRINSDANTLTLTGGIVGTGQALTIGGSGNTTISTTGINTSTAGTLTKDGSGVLLLNATNNYTGATTINAGTLRLGASDRIADSSDVVLADVASAVFDLNGFNETIANLTGGGTTGGNITLGAGTLIATQSLDGTYAGVISGSGGFTKAGSAVLTLSGANTYSGVTNISAGAIYATNNNSLGDTVGNTIIANNAALHIAGGVTIAEALNITGTGLSSAGAIRSISGNNTLSGAITLAGSSRINSDANTLTLTGGIVGTGQALTIGGSGNTTISTAGINTSTAGTLTKDGSGVLLLNATNNYTGATTINAGTLRLGASDRIANNSDVVLADVASAVFDLNGFNETIANLTGGGTTGGNITLGAGALLTVTQSVNGTYAGVISGSGGLTKAGSAVLTLSGANTYSGVTNISAGAIYATNNNSLGDTVGNTIIANNAALHIGGGVTIAEALNITGTGIFSTGALRNISGNNTLSGVITLAGSTRINSDANTLTLTGGIVGTGQALIIGGSGNTTISTTGINTSTSGALTKDGSGVLLLNVASNYTGLTTINGGTISIANASGLGDASGGTVVSSGATLDINNVNINNEELTLSGNGVSNNGALITTGTSSFSGNINILNNSTVNINNASELTLSGIVSGIGDLTKIGNGMLILSGSNTYTGKTYINAGTIDVKNADGLGSISEGTVVAANATLSVDNLALSSELLTLSGEGVGSLGALVGNGVTLIPGDIIINGNVGVGVPGSSVMTVSGNISGVGSITKIGTGTLILLGDDISVNTQNITGDNTFSMVPESVLDNVSNKVYIQVPIFSRDSDDALEINVNGFDLKKSLKDFMDKMELSIVER